MHFTTLIPLTNLVPKTWPGAGCIFFLTIKSHLNQHKNTLKLVSNLSEIESPPTQIISIRSLEDKFNSIFLQVFLLASLYICAFTFIIRKLAILLWTQKNLHYLSLFLSLFTSLVCTFVSSARVYYKKNYTSNFYYFISYTYPHISCMHECEGTMYTQRELFFAYHWPITSQFM